MRHYIRRECKSQRDFSQRSTSQIRSEFFDCHCEEADARPIRGASDRFLAMTSCPSMKCTLSRRHDADGSGMARYSSELGRVTTDVNQSQRTGRHVNVGDGLDSPKTWGCKTFGARKPRKGAKTAKENLEVSFAVFAPFRGFRAPSTWLHEKQAKQQPKTVSNFLIFPLPVPRHQRPE